MEQRRGSKRESEAANRETTASRLVGHPTPPREWTTPPPGVTFGASSFCGLQVGPQRLPSSSVVVSSIIRAPATR
ncbi:hypothetical protein MRX96_016225 [Rhipicephalus microplus]